MRTKFKNKISLCACGCGNPVGWSKQHKKHNKFIWGHNWNGKEHSIKSKLKMSKIRKGIKFSKEHKRKLSEINIGRKHSVETKEKMSIAGKGRKASIETILKRSGKNNSRWKGGISFEPYCIDWTKEYKEYIKERDNHTCQNPDCWHTTDYLSLTVHHINYTKKNCSPKNLITLCHSCNSRANKNREEHTKFYQEIIEQKYLLKKVA